MPKAIILLSGGLDSTVILALALAQGRQCFALSFDYAQRHHEELKCAQKIAGYYDIPHRIISIDSLAFGQSSLVSDLEAPYLRTPEQIATQGTPNTYVPARNTLFLAYALGQCELLQANEIHFGANCLDGPYPDCRPAYLEAFQQLICLATKQAVENRPPQLITPLLHWDKSEIIRQGLALKAPLELTLSCYRPLISDLPCQTCDACTLRNEGFRGCQQINENEKISNICVEVTCL